VAQTVARLWIIFLEWIINWNVFLISFYYIYSTKFFFFSITCNHEIKKYKSINIQTEAAIISSIWKALWYDFLTPNTYILLFRTDFVFSQEKPYYHICDNSIIPITCFKFNLNRNIFWNMHVDSFVKVKESVLSEIHIQ